MTKIPLPDHHVSQRALNALLKQRSLLAALAVFHAELGDIFQIPLPGFRPVMLAGPEANRFVLVEERGNLRWRNEGDPVTRLLRHGVLVEDGDTHDELRRQMHPGLHRKMMEHYVGAMWQCTDSVIDTWNAYHAQVYVCLRSLTASTSNRSTSESRMVSCSKSPPTALASRRTKTRTAWVKSWHCHHFSNPNASRSRQDSSLSKLHRRSKVADADQKPRLYALE